MREIVMGKVGNGSMTSSGFSCVCAELDILFNAGSADVAYDSLAFHPPPKCEPHTRIRLLKNIRRWVDSGKEKILFLAGVAGAGKTAIAQTVADAYAGRGVLAASYFTFRGSSSANKITHFIPTMTHQIATSSRKKREIIQKAMEGPSLLHKPLEAQLDRLIIEPYSPSWLRGIFPVTRPDICLISMD